MSATIATLPSGQVRLKCYNPRSGESLGELECHSLEAVDQVLENLRQAAAGYNRSAISERVRLVRRFRKALAQRLDDLIATICAETGKTQPEALLEIFGALELMRYGERIAGRTLRREYRPSGALLHKRGYVDYRPYGVAVIIAPWNYPFVLVVGPVVEALLAGNAVVAKPSEYTSLSALLLKEIFDAATGRPELFSIVLGAGAVGQHLVSSPLSDIICFTGSSKVGAAVGQACAARLKPAILELGGKDPMIVLDDANLSRAAKAAVWGGFTNAGQTCVAVERVYVLDSVYDRFLHMVRAEAQKLTADGQPSAVMGPVTVDSQVDRIKGHLRDAESKGARIERFGSDNGRQLPPAVITNVDHSMTIMTEETFGPELAIMSVASEEDAIRQANDSRFGLSAYIFTGSERRGRRVARQLACGSVAINDVIVQFGMASLPFGGWRNSGLGRLHGREGLLSFSQQQAVVGSRVALPAELWWYGMGARSRGWMQRCMRWWYG